MDLWRWARWGVAAAHPGDHAGFRCGAVFVRDRARRDLDLLRVLLRPRLRRCDAAVPRPRAHHAADGGGDHEDQEEAEEDVEAAFEKQGAGGGGDGDGTHGAKEDAHGRQRPG